MIDLIDKTAAELTAYIDAIGQLAMVSITDSGGYFVQVNQKFCEVSGYSQEEFEELLKKNLIGAKMA